MYKPALESLRSQIRASTTSMTSVPKPLKFLRQHYESLKEVYEKIKDETAKVFLAITVTWGKTFRGSFGRPSNITVTWGKRFRGSFGRPSNITVTWRKRFRGSFGTPSNITVTWGKRDQI